MTQIQIRRDGLGAGDAADDRTAGKRRSLASAGATSLAGSDHFCCSGVVTWSPEPANDPDGLQTVDVERDHILPVAFAR